MATSRDARGRLVLGGVALEEVAALAGTPTYVYDLGAMRAGVREITAAFGGDPHLVAYAVKANSAGPVVRAVAAEGAGADVVSGPELALALGAGISPDRIVYSGVAKTDAELDLAVAAQIRGVQIESVEEVERVAARARAASRRVKVAIRVNPEVDLETLATHQGIATGHDDAKFGVALSDFGRAFSAVLAQPELELVGLTTHVGSQFTQIEPYVVAARRLFELAAEVASRAPLSYLDTGGGFGIDYGQGCPVAPADFVRAVRAERDRAGFGGMTLVCEPGRSLVASHGVLLSRVVQRKVSGERRWLMIDAGMNDLVRPAMYQARHRIVPVEPPAAPSVGQRVVGPVCESSDDFGSCALPERGFELVAILDAGAYGYTMASAYNGRALPAEVFVEDGKVAFVRPRAAASAWVEERLAAGRA